jgi:ketosteroid isomerase-like protein
MSYSKWRSETLEQQPALKHSMTLGAKSAAGAIAAISIAATMFTTSLSGESAVHSANLQRTITQYRLAQKEFVKGNPEPLKAICSHAADVTIMGGWGGFEKGWAAQVERRYDWASARYASDEDQRQVENVSLVETPELAYSVDIERSKVRLANSQVIRSMALRVTTIFRLESGDWKLVHRHADPFVDVQPAASITRQ